MFHFIAAALISAQTTTATPVAEEPSHPIFERMAETVVAMAAREGDAVPATWASAGLRARSVNWHLAGPDIGDDWYRRRGWISQGGRQVGVAACGGETGVAMIGFQIRGETMAPLISALAALGDLRSEVDHGDALYWFEPEASAPAMITSTVNCTPPGSAAARSCETDIQVTYALDFRARRCIAP